MQIEKIMTHNYAGVGVQIQEIIIVPDSSFDEMCLKGLVGENIALEVWEPPASPSDGAKYCLHISRPVTTDIDQATQAHTQAPRSMMNPGLLPG